ncbi:MAG: tetratricopeptide repeat protein [Sphingomonadaceae bacterium]
MPTRDHHDLALSGASRFAADNYREALNAYHCYTGDPATLLEAACADSPGFVMGYVLTAYLTLIGSNAELQTVGCLAYEAARALPCNERERGHVAAIGHLIAGEWRAAGRVLEDVAIDNPRDGLALQVGQLVDYSIGDTRMLRDRIARALPTWSARMPDYHAVLGMLAFGLEENAQYGVAEAAGRKAIDLQPRNGWARHAVAHVLEMQGRRNEGVAWFRTDVDSWSRDSFFQVHNWWHLALFHLGLGEVDEALALYDGPINGGRSDLAVDLIDAAALLWRLHLQGVDAGSRWQKLGDLCSQAPKGAYAFDDAHAMMALVGSGRLQAARELLAVQTAAMNGPGDNAGFVAEVGLPVMQALLAFGEERYGVATDLLRDVRSRSSRFGGSHAQRDIIDLTLIKAASHAGERSLERALLAERSISVPRLDHIRHRLAA